MLETIKIQNDKRCSHIDGLVLENLFQVNLITGLNGIGKTTLLKYILENTPKTGVVYLSQERNCRVTRRIFVSLIKDLWQRRLRPSDCICHFLQSYENLGLKDSKALQYIHGCLFYMPRENGILLIDDIELSLHYTTYHYLWAVLILLSEHFNFQIFATTHSIEMIASFANIAKRYNNVQCVLIEMARNETTNKLVAINRDIDLLLYCLENENGRELRGE
jgi:AAA15 family ATPase/GTPase